MLKGMKIKEGLDGRSINKKENNNIELILNLILMFKLSLKFAGHSDMSKDWTKITNAGEEMYYVNLEKGNVVFGHVFEGGRTIIQWQCSYSEFFSEEHHEAWYRIKEIFGEEMIEEIKYEIQKPHPDI